MISLRQTYHLLYSNNVVENIVVRVCKFDAWASRCYIFFNYRRTKKQVREEEWQTKALSGSTVVCLCLASVARSTVCLLFYRTVKSRMRFLFPT